MIDTSKLFYPSSFTGIDFIFSFLFGATKVIVISLIPPMLS